MDSEDISFRLGHRERLRQRFLESKLVDYELFELLLACLIPRCDVRPIARQMMKRYGSVHQILIAPVESLIENKGIKRNTAISLKVIHSIMIAGFKGSLKDAPIFYDYSKLSEYCKLLLAGKAIEEFHVLYLDSDYRLLADDMHSSGTIDWAAVYPREIIKRTLELNARSIVMLHNHPTPNTSFSSPDLDMTETLKNILKVIDVDLFDHLLVSGSVVYSAKNMFLIK